MIEVAPKNPFNNIRLPQIIKPPQALPERFDMPVVFLAGSIDQGVAKDWQIELAEAFVGKRIIFLNPRRDYWDASRKQERCEPQFRQQVLWELEGMERADFIVMYFQPGTKSPVSLLELGLFARSNKIIVCCPEGFWRKGNVDIVCERYGIKKAESLDELKNIISERIEFQD